MRHTLILENIEEMRRLAGIEDVELLEEIRRLAVGDLVRLTLLSGTKAPAGVSMLIRITRIRDGQFRGTVAEQPAAGAPPIDSPVVFAAAHIHSVAKGRPARKP